MSIEKHGNKNNTKRVKRRIIAFGILRGMTSLRRKANAVIKLRHQRS